MNCIHRAGCPKPDICGEVGHCTSATREDLDMEKAAAALSSNERFAVRWDGPRCAYRVSIPNWSGGEVVHASAYDALRERFAKACARISELESQSETRVK